jgi:hypothetical protein
MDKKPFGAKALVYLKYDGELEELAKLLSEKMEIPEIYMDSDTDSPHEVFGMGGALGFDLWLHKSTQIEGFQSEFKIRTSMEHRDFMDNEMFDLSAWLAKEISRRCEIETFASQA